MLRIPVRYTLGAGWGEADTPLHAFEAALLTAGMGDLNLLRVTTILPPGAVHTGKVDVPQEMLVPTVYGTTSSQEPGQKIAAAVAVGIPADNGCGVIMECSGYYSQQEIEKLIIKMVEDAFTERQQPLLEIKLLAVEHTVERCGSVFAGVALWY